MGKTLADTFPEAARVFEEADDTLGFPLSRLCFEGPEDQLKLTEITQPALLTVSVAASRVLQSQGLRQTYVAGHSLGEYSAHGRRRIVAFADAVRTRAQVAASICRRQFRRSGRDGGAPEASRW